MHIDNVSKAYLVYICILKAYPNNGLRLYCLNKYIRSKFNICFRHIQHMSVYPEYIYNILDKYVDSVYNLVNTSLLYNTD